MTSPNPSSVACPPFFRGDGELTGDCDFLLDSGDACDDPLEYEVWWKHVPEWDLDTRPVSAACGKHVLQVDRSLVEKLRTYLAVPCA